MEGFIRDCILKQLIGNNNQYGFLKGRSTMLQLTHLTLEPPRKKSRTAEEGKFTLYLYIRFYTR